MNESNVIEFRRPPPSDQNCPACDGIAYLLSDLSQYEEARANAQLIRQCAIVTAEDALNELKARASPDDKKVAIVSAYLALLKSHEVSEPPPLPDYVRQTSESTGV